MEFEACRAVCSWSLREKGNLYNTKVQTEVADDGEETIEIYQGKNVTNIDGVGMASSVD